MNDSYKAELLPLKNEAIDYNVFLNELIDASAKLEVYKEKIKDSKLDSAWFMPTLQHKEALASSLLEGTQATLDGVLTNQIEPNSQDQNLNEVINYYKASETGMHLLSRNRFSDNFFKEMHTILMDGNVRKPTLIGEYRKDQNYIGMNNPTHAITFIPPVPEDVPMLMDNLLSYMNEPKDSLKPLVRIAIIHAQFETIHPFMDGNGRVGRMLIPMYLYAENQIELPCFFISEALEHDKIKYYTLLNNIRIKNDWNSWIKFFLSTVANQCEKYIHIISDINQLYERHISIASEFAKSSNIIPVMNTLFKYPITTAKQLAEITGVPMTSINRILTMMVDNNILVSNGKQRNRQYIYADLLSIIR